MTKVLLSFAIAGALALIFAPTAIFLSAVVIRKPFGATARLMWDPLALLGWQLTHPRVLAEHRRLGLLISEVRDSHRNGWTSAEIGHIGWPGEYTPYEYERGVVASRLTPAQWQAWSTRMKQMLMDGVGPRAAAEQCAQWSAALGDVAPLAWDAGMTLAEAKALVVRGELAEGGLQTLIALASSADSS